VAKFRGDRPRELGNLQVKKRRKKETSTVPRGLISGKT